MTQQQVQLVKASWRSLRGIDPVIVGDVFYSKLFYDHPQLKALFQTGKDEQSKKLIDMLNMIVGRLDRFDEVKEDIAALGIRHVHYGVKPQHYEAVGNALLWTLGQALGIEWTDDVKAAWATCYNELASTMLKGANDREKI